MNRKYAVAKILILWAVFGSGIWEKRSWAGVLATVGARWQAFSFKPIEDEPTPNYYGYGLTVGIGYSLLQALDFGLYGNYTPSQPYASRLGKEKVQLGDYGAEIGFRFAETIYIALRGGMLYYRMLFRTNSTEIDGTWRGPGGGASIGVFQKRKRENIIQFTFDVGGGKLKAKDVALADERTAYHFGLSLKYVFIGFDGFRLSSLFDSGFLKSLD